MSFGQDTLPTEKSKVQTGDFLLGLQFAFPGDEIETALGVETTNFGGYSSSSFNKGLGAGVSFGSYNPQQARFVLRVTCNWGSDIKYVVRNSVTYDPESNKLVHEVGKSPVKYILVQLGIGL